MQNRRIGQRRDVEDVTGLRRTAISNKSNPNSDRYDDTFPKSFKMEGSQTNYWVLDEVYAWVDEQIEKGRADTNPVHTSGQIAHA